MLLIPFRDTTRLLIGGLLASWYTKWQPAIPLSLLTNQFKSTRRLCLEKYVTHECHMVMLYGYLWSTSHRRLFRGALSVTGRWKEVFKLCRDGGDIPCSITLRSAGGVSFQSAGPTTTTARFWDREVQDQGIRWMPFCIACLYRNCNYVLVLYKYPIKRSESQFANTGK